MKLTESQKTRIRELTDQGRSQGYLAAMFEVSQATISRVLSTTHTTVKKLTPDQVQALRLEARTSTLTQVNLAERYGVTQGEVSRILSGALYGNVEPSQEEVELENRLRSSRPAVPTVNEE